jgi:hypothetical protein
LRMQGKIYDNTEPTYYLGDIDRLLSSLRQTTSYQVDSNHAHCGLRVRLMPLLDYIQAQLSLDASIDIGVCAECWNKYRPEYAWSLAKRPVLWAIPRQLTVSRTPANGIQRKGPQWPHSVCLNRHVAARDLFMAVERHWTVGDYHQPPPNQALKLKLTLS